MHPLHPYLAAELVRAHQEQLRHDWRRTNIRGRRVPATRSVRDRLGWLMIDLGLHVVVAP